MHTLPSHSFGHESRGGLRCAGQRARVRTLGRWVLARAGVVLLAAQFGCGGASAAAPAASAPLALDVWAVRPAGGPIGGGTPIAIVGRGFRDGATVTIGGVAATGVRVTSSNSLTASAPAGHAPGDASVVVTNPGGRSATLPFGYRYMPDVPSDDGCPGCWDY